MICYTCGKFIKRGHGKNTYYYAGEWRYYCFFCLRQSAVSERIIGRRQSYFWWISVLTLILSFLAYSLTIYQAISKSKSLVKIFEEYKKSYFSRLALFLAVLPIIGAIILWQLKIGPKLAKLEKKDREPILKEKARIEQLENFVYSLKKGKEFCHCWKCLVAESEKRKKLN